MTTSPWDDQVEALGQFIRTQRQLANLSLRQLSELAGVSNPYLSQIERGLHEPSVRVVQSIAKALNLSAETLLEQAGIFETDDPGAATDPSSAPSAEMAIRTDPGLTPAQKDALLAVYRSYREQNTSTATRSAPPDTANADASPGGGTP